MLKAILSFSKKVPVPGQKFSSQSYHLSLESELPDGMTKQEIHERLHQTFELVKQSVESELNGGSHRAAPDSPSPTDGIEAPASPRQIKFITDLCGQLKLSMTELAEHIRKRFNVDGGVYALTRKQATRLISELKTQAKAA